MVRKILPLLMTAILAASVAPLPFYFQENSPLLIQDFAYHISLFDSFFRGEISNPYSVGEQQRALQHLFSKSLTWTMPVGLSPIAVFLSYPFCLVSRADLSLAVHVWAALSIFLVMGAVTLVFARKDRPLGLMLSLFGILSSQVAVAAVSLGQTSLLAAGVLLMMTEARKSFWVHAVGVLVLSIKLPYLALGLAMVWRNLEWPKATLVVGGVFFLNLLAVFALGDEALWSYLATLRTMLGDHQFEGGYRMAASYNLTVFSFFEAPWFRKVLLTVLTGVSLAGALFFLRGRALPPPSKEFGACGLTAVLVCIFTCFSRYGGAYEELLLLPVLCMLPQQALPRLRVQWLLLILLILVVMNREFFLSYQGAATMVFTGKVVLFFFPLYLLYRAQNEVVRSDGPLLSASHLK